MDLGWPYLTMGNQIDLGWPHLTIYHQLDLRWPYLAMYDQVDLGWPYWTICDQIDLVTLPDHMWTDAEYLEYWLLKSRRILSWLFLVIEKFNFPQGSLKNATHQFYFIIFPNVSWFLAMISHLNGIRKSFQMYRNIMYRELNPFRIHREIEQNIFAHFWFWELLASNSNSLKTMAVFAHHATNISKALMLSNDHGF